MHSCISAGRFVKVVGPRRRLLDGGVGDEAVVVRGVSLLAVGTCVGRRRRQRRRCRRYRRRCRRRCRRHDAGMGPAPSCGAAS